jgi:divalent metal cation (Fe/Co/Zn/Cd) transporter
VHLRWIGHELVADASISVEPSLGITEAHAIAHLAEDRVLTEVPRTRRVVVHTGPAA